MSVMTTLDHQIPKRGSSAGSAALSSISIRRHAPRPKRIAILTDPVDIIEPPALAEIDDEMPAREADAAGPAWMEAPAEDETAESWIGDAAEALPTPVEETQAPVATDDAPQIETHPAVESFQAEASPMIDAEFLAEDNDVLILDKTLECVPFNGSDDIVLETARVEGVPLETVSVEAEAVAELVASDPAAPEDPSSPPAATLPERQPVEAKPSLRSTGPKPWRLIDKWMGLRGDRLVPLLSDLDADQVLSTWPDTLLFKVSDRRGNRIFELVRGHCHSAADDPDLPFVERRLVDSVMALANQAVRDGLPEHEIGAVRTEVEEIAFGAVAVPFVSSGDTIDHVLCHLYRTDGQSIGLLPDPRRAPMRWTTKVETTAARPHKESFVGRVINRVWFKRKARL